MEIYDENGEVVEVEVRKNGIWARLGGGSLTIAALLHLVALLAGAYWIFQVYSPPEKKEDFLPAGGGSGGERGAQHQVQLKKRSQITPTTNMKRVFAEGAAASYAMPEQGEDFGEMSSLSSLSGGGMSGGLGGSGSGSGFGKGSGVGGGLGAGGGMGKLFGLVPESMRKRCSKEDRMERLAQNGGTPACEDAVMKALRWFKQTQAADGSWGGNNKAAMTGLVLLAYLGHCETPVSEEFGESCMKGIVYLVDLGMKNNGKLASDYLSSSWCYEHGIATYALGEAATFCKELKINVPSLTEVTGKAGQFIIDSQHRSGGWAYHYDTSDKNQIDVSITGWQVQALKACSHTGIKYRGMSVCIGKTLDYLVTCQAENGGFGYIGKAPSGESTYFTLTGVGMLCHQMWGKGGRSEVRKAAQYITGNTKFDYKTKDGNLYAHYYESQAMMQLGGTDWKFYNNLFRDQLLNNQDADGSWPQPGMAREYSGEQGKVYRTALCTLMLEVYYRFLNSGGGGKERGGL